ncbi:hypothetical protein KTO58_06380 [Chitinophaga pendula]|uniref:DUF5723 family protein n=1 Tax=Chitinophaga TaxID=79328 RepID=UPI000BB0120D|nr:MULTISPECIES: DUF5723 family protein [Chitinophaga]ASZ13556.1 hypothetical protein CK934_22680 [Chitinophaga sp. MD30]UCJ08811.1 hypothetical protein KTO58_06380 [Chitinophaga pendula]
MTVNFRWQLPLLMTALSLANTAHGQTFPGYNTSNYSGIHGIISNPAMGAGSRYKWDVNIAGLDVKGGNTYLSFPKSILFHMPDTLRRNKDYFLDTTARRKQVAWASADLVMPSVLYAIDRRQSVAFIWRIRAMGNGGNINTGIANFFNNFPNSQYNGRRINLDRGAVNAHLWNEFGFSYSRILKDDGIHRWKGGATLKILGGMGAGYGIVQDASFVLNNQRSGTITSGTLKAAYNEDVDKWVDQPLRNYKPLSNLGLGLDLGVVYEFNPDGDGAYDADGWNPEADMYKLRIGASITDIGGIRYKKSPLSADLDLTRANIDPNQLKYRNGESWKTYYRRIKQYFTPTETDDNFYMNLPTALNLMADYNIDGRFFVSANAVVALTAGEKDDNKTYAMTQIQITPRYERRYFGAYMPIQVNRFGQADVGAVFRVGPLVLGSASLFSNLFRKHVDHADAFVALRITPFNFQRKDKRLNCPPY